MFSPSGALVDATLLDRAITQLQAMGFDVQEAPQARERVQRFAGDERTRAGSIELAVQAKAPTLLMATRGGYGLSRLLPMLNFAALTQHLNAGQHVLCGHSDVTSLQLALLNAGANPGALLHGPMACFDFGPEQGVDSLTQEHFLRAIHHRQVDIRWTCLESKPVIPLGGIQGPVWGGNLTLLCSLLGTPWLPTIQGGILVLEDVNEPAYRIERMLLQLLHAGVLNQQKAIVLGNFSEPRPGVHDNGYNLLSAAEFIQSQLRDVPVLLNFPFGHCTPKACWFQGGQGELTQLAPQALRLTQSIR